jgi:hypothetical protein
MKSDRVTKLELRNDNKNDNKSGKAGIGKADGFANEKFWKRFLRENFFKRFLLSRRRQRTKSIG